jgi:hypothetical protein
VTDDERRAEVRIHYDERCGYCGVHETEAATELEIDHFQPRSAGGSDAIDNLVYCCTTCNRFKGDFWPKSDPHTTTHRLLHPKLDNLTEHVQYEQDGQIIGITETAMFHIARLRLNRPPLVMLRRSRNMLHTLRRELAQSKDEQARLRARLAQLEHDLQNVLTQISRLLDS